MKADFFALYDTLASGVDSDDPALDAAAGARWTMAMSSEGLGVAMTTPGDSIPPLFPRGLRGLPLREAAKAAASWNLTEAGFGLAAANAFYNTSARMEALGSFEPFENYSTAGIDLEGLTVGIIGHMNGPRGLREKARAVYVIERAPKPGDYPDAACDWILPRCDLVLITGSSLVNKTLPHLLEICREDAVKILTGPSVPMCPGLLEHGLTRLAGLVVTDREGMAAYVREGRTEHPYIWGQSFLLKKR